MHVLFKHPNDVFTVMTGHFRHHSRDGCTHLYGQSQTEATFIIPLRDVCPGTVVDVFIFDHHV